MNLKTLVAHTAETNMRHPITQFTYFGVPYDYTGDGYEIDDDLRAAGVRRCVEHIDNTAWTNEEFAGGVGGQLDSLYLGETIVMGRMKILHISTDDTLQTK